MTTVDDIGEGVMARCDREEDREAPLHVKYKEEEIRSGA